MEYNYDVRTTWYDQIKLASEYVKEPIAPGNVLEVGLTTECNLSENYYLPEDSDYFELDQVSFIAYSDSYIFYPEVMFRSRRAIWYVGIINRKTGEVIRNEVHYFKEKK